MAAAIARINQTNALNLLKTSLNISHTVHISSKTHSESWSNAMMVICHVTSASTALLLSCACVELNDAFLDQPQQRHLVASLLKKSSTDDRRNTYKHFWKSINWPMLAFRHPYGYKIQTLCVSTLSHARFWSITLSPGYGRPAVVCLPLVADNVTTLILKENMCLPEQEGYLNVPFCETSCNLICIKSLIRF